MCAVGGPVGSSVVVGQPLCFRGLDLHLSLLGLGLIHLPPVGPLEEATLGEEGARLDHWLHTNGTEQFTVCQLTHRHMWLLWDSITVASRLPKYKRVPHLTVKLKVNLVWMQTNICFHRV